MRNYDKDDAERLNAQQWQIDLLRLNPSYCHWGPHEDYMWKKGEGWDSPVISATWADFGPWNLDEYNEVVNFYFSVNRASEECKACGGNGYHQKAQTVVNGFYSHMNALGESWCDKITQDELDALIEANRIKAGKTLDEVNAENRPGARGFGHDAINRSILTRTRLERFGLPVLCDCCDGHGYVHTEPDAHVSLTLWVLHPRKGCSRGVEVTNITPDDLPAVFAYLSEAAKRNAERFASIAAMAATQPSKKEE
jgi:hypothetical protein